MSVSRCIVSAMSNPYAKFLGSRDPMKVIAGTPAELAALLTGLSVAQLNCAPAPGKWSITEILAHLADCELVFGVRLRQTLAEPHHVIQPFDQELWAKQYGSYGAYESLETFTGARRWNVQLLDGVNKDDWQKPVTHPERGTMNFRTIVETMAGHDRNHLAQIEKLAGKMPA